MSSLSDSWRKAPDTQRIQCWGLQILLRAPLTHRIGGQMGYRQLRAPNTHRMGSQVGHRCSEEMFVSTWQGAKWATYALKISWYLQGKKQSKSQVPWRDRCIHRTGSKWATDAVKGSWYPQDRRPSGLETWWSALGSQKTGCWVSCSPSLDTMVKEKSPCQSTECSD